MATLEKAFGGPAGAPDTVVVPAAAGVPATRAVVLVDGEGAILASDGGALSSNTPGATGQHSTAAANTAVVQTIAAVAAKSHRLVALSLSYSAAPTGGKITVADGASTILELDVTAGGPLSVPLPAGGLKGSVNTAMTVTLAAAGAGVIGKVNTSRVTA